MEFRGVGLTYRARDGSTLALDGVDLAIRPGEFVAIVGPSGCGKTTFLKLTSGLLLPTQGEVRVQGKPVRGPLKIVGMAFQNPTLLPWRTTLENVLLPLEIVQPHRRLYRRNRGAYREKALGLLQSVGLEGFVRRYPWQLSGGMQQRASLCRALIHEPDILLLDEPFGALDAFTREELWLVLQKLCLERKCTTILVTHDLREAIFLADTVHVMSKRPGRLVARREVTFPRPRGLEACFTPQFLDLYQGIRGLIGEVREAT
ncbi:MAG: ABC transporter ATP-binding protein [Candidatus Bipolaricaulota bacterium]|nr:ABC transporter ATP-binding protein [Candidatus Bipolaricaulota bacterium]